MANNLHISYDLINPGQNYDKVIERVKELGNWAKVHASFWYVNSNYTAREAADHIATSMDGNDKVYVIDATNNQAAWNQLPKEVGDYIIDRWYK